MNWAIGAAAAVGLVLWLAPPAAAPHGCGTFPAEVLATSTTGATADCALRELGAPALWRGLPADATAVTRFSFSDGRGQFFRTVTITESADGAGALLLQGYGYPFRRGQNRMQDRRVSLSAEDIATLNRLGEEAQFWHLANSSWDDPDEIYLHCQALDMERIDADGYRYSGVQVSCNRPRRLMPLVKEVVRLSGLRDVDGVIQ